MIRSVAAATILLVACAAGSGCSSGSEPAPPGPAPTAYAAAETSCTHDVRSLQAKDTIERVGGLVDGAFTVRFAKSTRLGIVALVSGDPRAAFSTLHGTYGVALVAPVRRDDDPGKVASFAQVRELVAAACR